jgi:hypothetical protein
MSTLSAPPQCTRPGSNSPEVTLYHGKKRDHLKYITEYAIERYGMHCIIDIHSLPGGVNYQSFGECTDCVRWFFNETNLQWSYYAVEEVAWWIQRSRNPWGYTLQPINEPQDNETAFLRIEKHFHLPFTLPLLTVW